MLLKTTRRVYNHDRAQHMQACQDVNTIACDRSALLRALWQVIDDAAAVIMPIHQIRQMYNGQLGDGARPFLEYLSRLDDEQREIIAGILSLPPPLLEAFARDKNIYVRCNLARNPNITSGVLRRLSKDEHYWVRVVVAGVPNAPPESLHHLSKDAHADVRVAVAGNPNTPLGFNGATLF